MVISKRKLTFKRLFYIIGILTLILILRHLIIISFPLDLNNSQVNLLQRLQQENKLFNLVGRQLNKNSQKKESRSSKTCKVFGLTKNQLVEAPEKEKYLKSQCQRVQPLPGSCDIAEKIFFSKTTATCKSQVKVDFCSLIQTASGHVAKCSANDCNDLHLSAAAPDVNTGELFWTQFNSTSALENWVNSLLNPLHRERKHFGYFFIACGSQWVNFDGEKVSIIPDEDVIYYDFANIQLLLLPPSGIVKSKVVKKVSSMSSSKHANFESKPDPSFEINFNLIFIDSLSRQHFFRSLPKTVQLFQRLINSKSDSSPPLDGNYFKSFPEISVFDFELFQSVRSRTFETLQTLFSGEINPSVKPFGALEFPPEPLKVQVLLKRLKDQGYSTLWLEDMCYLWEWGLSKDLRVHNKSLSKLETWSKFQEALKNASIDSVEVTYAMCRVLSENGVNDNFHGPDAVCFNSRHQHQYLLDYLWLYQDTLSQGGLPYFTLTVTDVGHEDTGRRIQTLDADLEQYLLKILSQDNTLTVVFSDHGNSYGDFMARSAEARMELFHPHLFVLVPRRVAEQLGEGSMEGLRVNQKRLISHLDLHYMLMGLATGFTNRVPVQHFPYDVTNAGLLRPVSALRTCNHIPRIMPNLCICKNFEMEVESDAYHALFAHMAVDKINNFVQRQFQQQTLMSGHKPSRGFGSCRQLLLGSFNNAKKSFNGTTVSLKMDLQVPWDYSPLGNIGSGQDLNMATSTGYDGQPQDRVEVFFVALRVHLGGESALQGSIVLETLDRITPYSKFSACADRGVKLQLCLCDLNTSDLNTTDLNTSDGLVFKLDKSQTTTEANSDPDTSGKTKAGDLKASSKLESRLPTVDSLLMDSLHIDTEILVANGTDKCLVLVVKKNKHGGVFLVANLCEVRVFQVMFTLEVSEMFRSDETPKEEIVYPGQEIFLCMAVANAPNIKWDWSFTLKHKSWQLL